MENMVYEYDSLSTCNDVHLSRRPHNVTPLPPAVTPPPRCYSSAARRRAAPLPRYRKKALKAQLTAKDATAAKQ
jgi:hypothetical protein